MNKVLIGPTQWTLADMSLIPDGMSGDMTLMILGHAVDILYQTFEGATDIRIVNEKDEIIGLYAGPFHVNGIQYLPDALIGYEDAPKPEEEGDEPEPLKPIFGEAMTIKCVTVDQTTQRIDDLENTVDFLTEAVLGG